MRWSILATLAALLGAAGDASADQILFRNGDRLTGKLISLVGGKVKLASPLLGEVEFDAQEVGTFETTEAVEIHTADGSVIVSSVVADEEGAIRTAPTSVIGEQLLRLTDAVAINPPAPEPPDWDGSLMAGTKLERGNTIKDSAYADLKAEYERERDRIALRGSYEGERTKNRSTGESTTNDRNLYGEVSYDYFLTEKMFWFATSSAEKDGPSELDLRFIGGGGLGYRWFRREDLKLSARLGLTWTSENYRGSDRDDDYLAALLAWNFERRLVPSVRFFHNGRWLPSLEDFDDRQNWKTETGIRTDVASNIFVEGKVLWELDTEPASNKERQDVDYIFGLGYSF
jgi:hypothetical protein